MTDIEHKIFVRCIEEGDCWIWQGAVAGGPKGSPCVNWGGKTQRVRRMLWEGLNGPTKPGWVVVATCGERLCVSPGCAQCVTYKKSKQLAAARGAYSNPARIRRATQTKLATSRITPEIVERIRCAEGPVRKVAEDNGVSLSYTKSIRSGRARQDYSNPFAGLGA